MSFKIEIKNGIKRFTSPDYNYTFNLNTGDMAVWGKTEDENPTKNPYSPEILDIEITTICKGPNGVPCHFCSPAGSKINTIFGLINIEDLKVGDNPIGYDTTNKIPKIQEIQEIYQREYSGELIVIELENSNIIKLTPNHRIILASGKEIAAEDLSITDDIIYF